MWQRFSERGRQVIFYSQEVALQYGENYVSTEHLLLALCRLPDSAACRILERLGVSIESVRAEIHRQLPRADAKPSQDMTLTPRAKRCIDLAYDEARNLNNNFIGTEHLLLGLIREGDGLAGRALNKLGAELQSARAMTIEVQDVERQAGPSNRVPVNDTGFIERMRQRLGLSSPSQSPNPAPPVPLLPVRYDFHLLNPVDQLLLAVLSDSKSELALSLPMDGYTLQRYLPAVVVEMAKESANRTASITDVLTEANQMAAKADKGQVSDIDIFLACLIHTTDNVRSLLTSLGINPISGDEIPKNPNQPKEDEA